jgi:hypothetical protein
VFSVAALVLAIFAGTVFIVIIVLGSGGVEAVAEVFRPIAIGATVLGVACAIVALVFPRARVLGITALLVLLPSCALSLLSLVALSS